MSLSKRIAYVSRNQINQITNHVLQLNEDLKTPGVEMEKTAIIRPSNKKLLSLTQLRQIVGIFMIGKVVHSTAESIIKLPLKSNEYMDLINIWFDELFKICPAGRIGNYHESMLASYPLLVSVALYVKSGEQNSSYEKRIAVLIERMEKLKRIDFSGNKKIWNQFSGMIKGKEK